jgi:3-oxoacyl-[acyl-carrier protein] reductase
MNLKGKTAIITGAGRGIGKDISQMLAAEGCKVVIVSRTESELKSVESEIRQSGGCVLSIKADISKKDDIHKIVGMTMDQFGTIDVLVNNAGILYDTPFFDITEQEWDKTMDVNLKGAFLLSQAVMKIMVDRKSGHIINMSSTQVSGVSASLAAYGISKHGIVGLSQALRDEGKKSGIKVSTVYPGMTDTKMIERYRTTDDPKWMLPEDIAYCVLFLLKQSERTNVRDIIPEMTDY